MNRVQQIKLGPPDGDCFAACVASILDLAIDRVPNFHGTGKDGTKHWVDQWRGWLAPANLGMVSMPNGTDIPPGFAILSIDSPRFDTYTHAVVMFNGRCVHDPFPGAILSNAEDTQRWKRWYGFVVIDPTIPIDLTALPAPDKPGYRTNVWGMPRIPIGSSRPGLSGRYDRLVMS